MKKALALATTLTEFITPNETLIEVLNIFAQRQYDILTPQKKLLEAAEHSFLLTTEQVSQILNFPNQPYHLGKIELNKQVLHLPEPRKVRRCSGKSKEQPIPSGNYE